jgi:hypothetical protein
MWPSLDSAFLSEPLRYKAYRGQMGYEVDFQDDRVTDNSLDKKLIFSSEPVALESFYVRGYICIVLNSNVFYFLIIQQVLTSS